jgi:hypothetical protein
MIAFLDPLRPALSSGGRSPCPRCGSTCSRRPQLHACHRVLPNIEGREDELAEAIRETCRTVEARLRELGADPLVPER